MKFGVISDVLYLEFSSFTENILGYGMLDFQILWHSFEPPVKQAAIGAITTLFAATLGFGGVIWQISSQGRLARKSIVENEKRKLKTSMYNDSVTICRELADSAIELATQLRIMAMQISMAADASAANLNLQIPTARFPALLAGHSAFSDAACRFIFLIENRRIVDPRIIIFRTAISVVLYDTSELMHSHFVIDVMPRLPVEAPDGQLFPFSPPSRDQAQLVRVLSERFIASLEEAISYTEDFSIEMQNQLLGNLFGHNLPHRKPLDPNYKVIELDQAEELEKWFATSTGWGRNNARIEAEMRSSIT